MERINHLSLCWVTGRAVTPEKGKIRMWRSIIPTEHEEQKRLIEWCTLCRHSLPEAGYIFAIPNGGLRHPVTGAKLRAEGVRPGVPDLFLPVARGGFHGFFIEMKRLNGEPTLNQLVWKGLLTANGYAVCICRGADEAIDAIKGYLTDPAWRPGNGGL